MLLERGERRVMGIGWIMDTETHQNYVTHSGVLLQDWKIGAGRLHTQRKLRKLNHIKQGAVLLKKLGICVNVALCLLKMCTYYMLMKN